MTTAWGYAGPSEEEMVTQPYPIINVPAPTDARRTRSLEQMGTKKKFWLETQRTRRRVMVKLARKGSGEDWSEKLAYEIGQRCGVPCARVDLANYGGQPAVLCWDFLFQRRSSSVGGDPSLIHGNELLLQRDPQYPSGEKYGVPKHTLQAVLGVLENCGPAQGSAAVATDAFDSFVGYLMLDALIGNTDRHHENWGVVSMREFGAHTLRLAPSYDHASSLGRELNDVKRRGRLDSSGRGTLEEYAHRGRSALFSEDGAKLTPFEALLQGARLRPLAFTSWQGLLHRATFDLLAAEVERVPATRLTSIGQRFARELLRHNYHQIIQAQP